MLSQASVSLLSYLVGILSWHDSNHLSSSSCLRRWWSNLVNICIGLFYGERDDDKATPTTEAGKITGTLRLPHIAWDCDSWMICWEVFFDLPMRFYNGTTIDMFQTISRHFRLVEIRGFCYPYWDQLPVYHGKSSGEDVLKSTHFPWICWIQVVTYLVPLSYMLDDLDRNHLGN